VAAQRAAAAANAPGGVAVLADGMTPAGGGPPSVVLRTEATASRVTIVVSDHGIGIEPNDLADVFDPYFTTRRGGTGLGLAIAKNIIEGLRGTIGITSKPGTGTEIRIDLPKDAALSD